MANHFSALKRARQTEKRTTRNRANSSQLRTALRDMRESLEKGDKAAASQVYRETVSTLDKAIKKGVCTRTRFALQVPPVSPAQRVEIDGIDLKARHLAGMGHSTRRALPDSGYPPK